MKYIKLTKGQYAIVDNEDFGWLNQWKWFCVKGYAGRNSPRIKELNGKQNRIYMHREILKKYKFKIENLEVDHKNMDRLDNRKQNLRVATRQQNQVNKKSLKNNTSGIKGVYWNKTSKKWLAYISFNRRKYYAGGFVNLKDAEVAYKLKAKEFYGEFVNG